MSQILLFAALLSLVFPWASPAKDAAPSEFALKDGDTVAFLGDSITAARNYSRIIEDYTLLRFPGRKIRFVNAGKGGETAQGSLERLDEAVFVKGATVLTVAYGVNDIGWGMKADAEHKQAYLDGIARIIERCQAKGVRVFICSAAITNEAPDKAENGFLQKMCDEGLALAKSKNAGTIDIQRAMRSVQRRMIAFNEKQTDQKNPASLHVADGVHLNDVGQMAMAWAILKGLGAPAEVSSAVIDAKGGAVVGQEFCAISNVAMTSEGLKFTRRDERWPFNLQPLWTLVGWHMPISDELNRYGLTVQNLPAGKYEIVAGGRALGTWSDKDLAKGVNLASASSDPWQPGGLWHGQGQMVATLTNLRDELDWARRSVPNYLSANPAAPEIGAKAAAIEAGIIELQRVLAKPVAVNFEIKLAAKSAAQ